MEMKILSSVLIWGNIVVTSTNNFSNRNYINEWIIDWKITEPMDIDNEKVFHLIKHWIL